MDGTVKHFVKDGTSSDRHCDWIEDRHGNRTLLTYGLQVSIGGVTRDLLTRVTDPSGRYLEVTWQNLNTAQQLRIPDETEHRFRRKPNSDSNPIRTPIPAHSERRLSA